MKKYLLNVIFFAGSDDSSDVDRGLYILRVDKEISEDEMKNVFKEVNRLVDPYREDEEEFPISYEQGLNIDTLMEGIEIYTKGMVKKLLSNAGNLGNIENFFVIEQWQ